MSEEESTTVTTVKRPLYKIITICDTLLEINAALKDNYTKLCAVSLRKALMNAVPLVELIKEKREELQKILPQEFRDKQTAIMQATAKRDSLGHVLISNGNYIMDPELSSQRDTDMVALRTEYKEDIDKLDAAVEDINKALKDLVDVPNLTNRLKGSWFDPKTISNTQLDILYDYLENDCEEPDAPKSKKSDKPSK